MTELDLDPLERQILDGIFTKTDAVLIAGARIGLSTLIQRLREAEAGLRRVATKSTHTNHKYEVCGRCMARKALGLEYDGG